MLRAMSRRSVHEQFPDTATVVICRDGPNGAAARATATSAHLAYIETILDEINVAGPLYDDAGLHSVGSLYCLKTKSAARAREIIENDPFFKAGAFSSVEYFPHLPAAGVYIGGKVW
jgi:uncharacterized protein